MVNTGYGRDFIGHVGRTGIFRLAALVAGNVALPLLRIAADDGWFLHDGTLSGDVINGSDAQDTGSEKSTAMIDLHSMSAPLAKQSEIGQEKYRFTIPQLSQRWGYAAVCDNIAP